MNTTFGCISFYYVFGCRYMVPYEELYERISDYHIQTGHGGNVKLRMAITKYSVPRPAIEAFLATCVVCNYKKGTKRKLVVKPIISEDFNEKGQIDLIDFQSTPDGKFKWILIYQDHSTKFLSLRPLESKEPSEVATTLLSIFLTFGAPKIVQSDNGNEFLDSTITELNQLWPDCVIVRGQSRHPPNSIESDENIEGLLRAWMVDNKSEKWSIGLQFVQFRKNSSFNCVIGRSPYKALFGNDPKIGLNISNLSLEILHRIFKDGELENIRNKKSEDLIKTTASHCSSCGTDGSSKADSDSAIVCNLCQKIKETHQQNLKVT